MDVTPCTVVTAVRPSYNTYHVMFPEINLTLHCIYYPAYPFTTCIALSK